MLTNVGTSLFQNHFLNSDVFDYAVFRLELDELNKVFQNYENSLQELVPHISSIITLDKAERSELVALHFRYKHTLRLFHKALERLDDNLIGCGHVIFIVCDLCEQVERIKQVMDLIEERLENDDLRNIDVIELIQIVWDKYNGDTVNFDYDNIVEESKKVKPWLVIDGQTDEDGVVYIHSFDKKCDALKFIMRHGLKSNSLASRY